ncbi:hypothetical protein EBR04_05370, partial [bacterium]|nr:hypothetical protein [bacterium]
MQIEPDSRTRRAIDPRGGRSPSSRGGHGLPPVAFRGRETSMGGPPWRARRPFVPRALALWLLTVGGVAAAEIDDGFEGSDPVWTLAESDAAPSLAARERIAAAPHRGARCERLRFSAGTSFATGNRAGAPARRGGHRGGSP